MLAWKKEIEDTPRYSSKNECARRLQRDNSNLTLRIDLFGECLEGVKS